MINLGGKVCTRALPGEPNPPFWTRKSPICTVATGTEAWGTMLPVFSIGMVNRRDGGAKWRGEARVGAL